MTEPSHDAVRRFRPSRVLLAALACVSTATFPAASAQDDAKLFQKYCYECHGEGARKGKVDLEHMLTPQALKTQRPDWERAWKIVRHEFMPPVGAAAGVPSPAERKAMTDWIARAALGVDFANPDPGRVTIRRLNRVEYEYSVQDLFGYDFEAEQHFSSDNNGTPTRLRDRLPPDDTTLGFDNIGDFQTLSPALLERYFDIADYVVSQVVQDAPREPASDLSPDVTVAKSPTGRLTTHAVTFDATRAGDYRVDVQFTLGGWQDYGGGYDFALRLGDKTLAEDLVEVGGAKRFRYTKVVSVPAGKHPLTLTTDLRKADSKGKKNHLELRPKITVTGPLGKEFAVFSEAHRRVFTRGDAPKEVAGREVYAREILERVATRAFRRPVDRETLDGLVAMALRGSAFERGVAQALTAILTSPKFLFRAETQPRPDDPKAIHPLDEFALASRLSYLLWVSVPDDELLQLARDGKLRANLRPQVGRMLADHRSRRFFEDFPGQWLRTRNVLMAAIARDANLNPVRGAMKRETEMLFEYVARNDRDLIELVTADYTFINKPLAQYYGMKNVDGSSFQKVWLAADSKRGGGILTHGSFLVSTSNPNRTSPVKRGLFVLENLLAVQPPPPPPDIPPLDDSKVGGVTPGTVREQLAAHRENKSCAACHAHFDPIGVVLENYDHLGRWRDKENGQTIEARERTVTGDVLSGTNDLRSYFVARRERLYRAVTEKLLTYALGRGLEPYDAVTVDRVAAAVAADGGRFSTALLGIIESPAFQTRRGDDGGGPKDAPRMAVPPTPPPEKRRPPPRRFANPDVPAQKDAVPATSPDTTKPK
jgi:mono/diheme cytochrome c family protein